MSSNHPDPHGIRPQWVQDIVDEVETEMSSDGKCLEERPGHMVYCLEIDHWFPCPDCAQEPEAGEQDWAKLVALATEIEENQRRLALFPELVAALEQSLGTPYPDDMRILIVGIGGSNQALVVPAMDQILRWERRRNETRALLARIQESELSHQITEDK